MRTTIDVSDILYKKIKVSAAMEGISVKEFITRAVERELELSGSDFQSRRVRLPLVPSEKPGSLVLTSGDIAAALEEEDVHGVARH
jgi:hypothetical protein